MSNYHRFVFLSLAMAGSTGWAQPIEWQVAAAEDGRIVFPGLPTGTNRNIGNAALGNAGQTLYNLRINLPSTLAGYWVWRNGTMTRYARLSSTGVDGPGRSGAEAGHVFTFFPNDNGESGPDGQLSFLASAADPAISGTTTYGLWRWNGVRNVEVVRSLTDGPLGPGLGAGWYFPNNEFVVARQMVGGNLLLHAEVRSPDTSASRLVTRHRPGIGNQACMRTGTSEPDLAPGLTPGDSFDNISSGLARFSVNAYGTVHARLPASGSRSGFWALCNGSPRALVADDVTGRLGPDVGLAAAVFSSFASTPPHASGSQALVYWANWHVPPAASRLGLFRYDGQRNLGIAYNDSDGFFGPNWEGSTWSGFDTDSLSVSGEFAAFAAGVNTTSGTGVDGLWRVQAGQRPEPLALIGVIGALAPEPGRQWRAFDSVATLANGDVLVNARTNPGDIRDLWLFRQGQPHRKLLSIGDALVLPTSTGNVATTISSLSIPAGGARPGSGVDGWVGEDGSLLIRVAVPNYGTMYITGDLGPVRPDRLFDSGMQ